MKILVIQARPGIGDMCLFLPFIHEIAKNEKSKVTILTKNRSSTKHLVKNDPYVEEVIYFSRKLDLDLIKKIRLKKFKKSYIFHYGIKFILLCLFSKIYKIYSYGLIKKNSNISLDPKNNLKRWLNLKNINHECKIFHPKNNDNKNNIIIGIGGSGQTKKWKIDNYLSLINKLNKKYIHCKFIVAGGKDDLENFEYLKKNFYEKKLLSLCELDIDDSISFIVSSKMYIGNDTGFMHISGMLGVKSFGLFGDTPTNYAEYNKLIVPIIPKNFKSIGHNSLAIDKIEVDWVLEKIDQIL
jgi:heptosyltransferase-2